MRISVTIFVILISTYVVNASVLDPVIENVVHLKASKPPSGVPGIWKKKTIWKPRWVKEWKSAKVMKPVWRKVWSPIQIREWVPIPKPPPGWDSISTPLAPVRIKQQKAPLKSSPGHDSFGVQSSTKTLLWDPIPYPESQQPPPPPPFPQPLYNKDISCGKGRCDNTFSQSMNHEQILEIIGPRYQLSEYYQNPENFETVNRLPRFSFNGNNWRSPQSHQNFQPDNGFKSYQALPEFLVPPKFQSLLENNFPLQEINRHTLSIANTPIGHSSERETQNGFRQWIPFSSDNKVKEHLITKVPKHPYEFQTPDVKVHTENDENSSHKDLIQNSNNSEDKSIKQTDTSSTDLQPQAENDYIQEAQLVGELHYSEFDVPNLKPEHEQQLNLRKTEKVTENPNETIVGQESIQKPKTNQHFVAESKPKQTRKETNHVTVQSHIKQPEVHHNQDKLHMQKKNVSNYSLNSNPNFRQKEAIIKEISPIFKIPQNVSLAIVKNQTASLIKNPEKSHQLNPPFIKLMAGSVNTSKFQHQTEIYPVFDIPKRVNPISTPPNHRFFQTSQIKPEQNLFASNNSIRLTPVTAKSEQSLFDKNNRVQLVFATTSDDCINSKEEPQKTTTTEPYEIIFSSSSLSTREETTKSPLIIVTPAKSSQS